MANPYSITGSFTNPLTATQVDSIVNASISSTALAELNKALSVADGGNANKPLFDLTFDTAGGTQTSGTPDVGGCPCFLRGFDGSHNTNPHRRRSSDRGRFERHDRWRLDRGWIQRAADADRWCGASEFERRNGQAALIIWREGLEARH